MGGYYILVRSELFRYSQQRVFDQRLLLNTILAGIFVLMISYLCAKGIWELFPEFVRGIKSYYPIKIDYFGTACGSFVLSVLATEFNNLFIKKDKRISRSIVKIGNEFERLVNSCYRAGVLVCFTLKNDKVYVGWIQSLPVPSHDNYIQIFPVLSGYRNKETRELTFTTQYLDIYATYIQDGSVTDIEELTMTVLSIDEIVIANTFDAEMYGRFSNMKQAPSKA